ncbi:VOC family protein [Actinotalea fermentans]|uniref:Glyoxalase-like domain-containing protein n=1 Tax=Actinotalea fermentans TaxID=43671 RepID=A0A511YX41_9CELL|nr:VOC family protein [Actinotalea fermentans]KGM16257.1 hypothetical protein N867_01935 [Actinotalea fermentans ATCC 43279 = JCM 9966 = DSM 3133]GEN79773.1 hypothetical protein AFE02nite_15070 [Actinotalea fermentans]
MITWLTAFLDSPADVWDVSRRFWTGVTGYGLSAARGEHGDFQTLIPPGGDGFLRVQRLHDGGPRVHLDLHVADVRAAAEAAVALGAREVAASGHVVMSSPGGLPFCFVREGERRRPAPARWTTPDGRDHASLVDQVALDVPAAAWDAEVAFWVALTGWEMTSSAPGSEFAPLRRPADQPLRLLPHRLGEPTGPVRAHLDLASTDRAAETDRHVALGAGVEQVRDAWTVLVAPDARRYCITDRDPVSGVRPQA